MRRGISWNLPAYLIRLDLMGLSSTLAHSELAARVDLGQEEVAYGLIIATCQFSQDFVFFLAHLDVP